MADRFNTPTWKLMKDNPGCFWCGKALSSYFGYNAPNSATRDHVIPRSEGGSDSTKNIVVSCRACNQFRQHFTYSKEWPTKSARKKLRLIGRRMKDFEKQIGFEDTNPQLDGERE